MTQNNPAKTFLTATAVCSFLGALTTALLLFLPNPEAPDQEARAALFQNGLYMGKQWILFFHPQFNILASIGLGYLLFKKYPLQVIFGLFFLCTWAYTEMSQQALNIDALNQLWRPGYLEAGDDMSRHMYNTLLQTAEGISDSKYFLVIYGFGLGSSLFGLALMRETGFGRWIGWSLIFIGILSLASFLRYYLGLQLLDKPVNLAYRYIYSYLQPLVRIAIGMWILLEVKKLKLPD